MTEKRLTDIALLSIETDLSDTISLDDVGTEWYIPSFPNVMLELDDYIPEVSTAYNLNNSII